MPRIAAFLVKQTQAIYELIALIFDRRRASLLCSIWSWAEQLLDVSFSGRAFFAPLYTYHRGKVHGAW